MKRLGTNVGTGTAGGRRSEPRAAAAELEGIRPLVTVAHALQWRKGDSDDLTWYVVHGDIVYDLPPCVRTITMRHCDSDGLPRPMVTRELHFKAAVGKQRIHRPDARP